jgi:C-3',4' desaturase CrtD
MKVIVIGAGIGGLTTGSILAHAGLEVTLLEAHVYPGGCAGTFYHQGYRFDAGATLAAGFYPGGPMDTLAQKIGIDGWDVQLVSPAMAVHLPDGKTVIRWTDNQRHRERLQAFGPAGQKFWSWQERTADQLWSLALKSPAWPPHSLASVREFSRDSITWVHRLNYKSSIPNLLMDLFRPVSAHLVGAPEALIKFVDAQLLISAQTTNRRANALYGAAALDLPRRSPAYPTGGIGSIAYKLVEAIKRHGGRVHYRKEAAQIVFENHKLIGVKTTQGEWFPADIVVANLPPWNMRQLTSGEFPALPERHQIYTRDRWGAFTLYVGVDGSVFPPDTPLHHQIIMADSLGEGNSVFLSISPAWDLGRAPGGKRAVTLSTHTTALPWWDLYKTDHQAYLKQREVYARRLMKTVNRVFPNFERHAALALPGTPVTFKRFTRRAYGWVGGDPQTSLFRTLSPRISNKLWMVGDSIFPGQSIPGVILGGMRVARGILKEAGFGQEDIWNEGIRVTQSPFERLKGFISAGF